jgi:hypothetical protein
VPVRDVAALCFLLAAPQPRLHVRILLMRFGHLAAEAFNDLLVGGSLGLPRHGVIGLRGE